MFKWPTFLELLQADLSNACAGLTTGWMPFLLIKNSAKANEIEIKKEKNGMSSKQQNVRKSARCEVFDHLNQLV